MPPSGHKQKGFQRSQLIIAAFFGTFTACLWGLAYNSQSRVYKITLGIVGAVVGWGVAFAAVNIGESQYDRYWPVGFAALAALITVKVRRGTSSRASWWRVIGLILASLLWVFIGLVIALAFH